MNIAVLGSGGREHALAWKLSQSPLAGTVYVMPGNGGTDNNVAVDPMDFEAVGAACRERGVELLVVGPEDPLAAGIADHFAGSDLRVFGPGADGARLEGSKAWSKDFMARHGVATAAYRHFPGPEDARGYVLDLGGACVVKYDGLAAGKGVFVCQSTEQALEALATVQQRYGARAPTVVEACLLGNEVSILGITDGQTIALLPPSQDHKQLLDGDQGPNTGGMGAFCPVPAFDLAMLERVRLEVVEPTLRGLRSEGIDYHGVIYFGLMMCADGPKLLEYNVRLGDPETEAVLPALDSDLLELILACIDGTLMLHELRFRPGFVVDLVLASGGYPGSYPKGLPITGLEGLPEDVRVFHAGTRRTADGRLVTSGGRVLNVVAHGETLDGAIAKAYAAAEGIRFEGKCQRGDIGRREWLR
jgi:phosphoribosylamine--glycine ligase